MIDHMPVRPTKPLILTRTINHANEASDVIGFDKIDEVDGDTFD